MLSPLFINIRPDRSSSTQCDDAMPIVEVKLRPEQHLQGKEHEEVAHVDDRLVNKTVVVETTKARKGGTEGGCCGGGGKH